MAFHAFRLDVRAGQRELRLVVIELDAFPLLLVVAVLALFAELALVALVVLEGRLLPVLLVVAGLALLAVAALMSLLVVILAVTADAGLRQLFHRRLAAHPALVTGLALGILVLVAQRVLGVLVVIKIGRLPRLLVVAALALVAERTLVPLLVVVLPVAGDAFARQVLAVERLVGSVALVALGIVVLAVQRILGVLVVIEAYFLPAPVVVAGLALDAVAALVAFLLVDLLMARVTVLRRILVFLVEVAVGA